MALFSIYLPTFDPDVVNTEFVNAATELIAMAGV